MQYSVEHVKVISSHKIGLVCLRYKIAQSNTQTVNIIYSKNILNSKVVYRLLNKAIF